MRSRNPRLKTRAPLGRYFRMNMSDKLKLHDLRVKHGLGLELAPHEYHELLDLQAQEHVELQEALEEAESEFAAIGVR